MLIKRINKLASCSLNDCLQIGAPFLQDLCSIIVQFHLHKLAIAIDIEKAFLYVQHEDDQDYTRFLWLSNPLDPETQDMLNSLYVDNIIVGCDMEEGAIEYYATVWDMMQDGKFNLRSWASNSPLLSA